MNLLQKAERTIRAVQLVFWGALAGLILGTILGTLATRYWYTSLARPGPSGDSPTARVVISPPVQSGEKSATGKQGSQIMVKGHVKGPAKLAQSTTQPQEVPIETRECTITSGETIAVPVPGIPGPEEGKTGPGGTVGGTVDESLRGGQTIEGGGDDQSSGVATAPVDSVPAEVPAVAFHVGDRAEGTVTGELEIVDAAGRPITTEPLTITGDYSLEFLGPGQAELDLRFTAPAVMAIETPAQAAKNRAVYLSASAGWLADRPFVTLSAGYSRKWPLAGGLSVRADIEAGWAWTLDRDGPFVRTTAGIVYEF